MKKSKPEIRVGDSARTEEELRSALKNEGLLLDVHPAQEFVKNELLYGFTLEGKPHLVNSAKRIIPFAQAEKNGLRLKHNQVLFSRLSTGGVDAFVNDVRRVVASELYGRIVAHLKRFVRLTDEREYHLIALWIMGTYVFTLFRYFPYLHVVGEKASGKTLLLGIAQSLSFNGIATVNSTPAVIYRSVEKARSSLFIDEVETLRGSDRDTHSEMLSVLKQGYCKTGVIFRCSANDYDTVIPYSAYSPKMLAGINDIDDVLADRTLQVRMLRRLSEEILERYTDSDVQQAEQKSLVEDLYIMGLTYAKEIARLYHSSLAEIRGIESLKNRQADLWTPLVVLGHIVDGGSGQLTQEMLRFAADRTAERLREDESENSTVILLRVLSRMVETTTPIADERDIMWYKTDDAWRFVAGQEEVPFMSKSKLSRALGKLGVVIQPRNHGGKTERMYGVSRKSLADMSARYLGKSESVSVTKSVMDQIEENPRQASNF
jgi:hypothetical protein